MASHGSDCKVQPGNRFGRLVILQFAGQDDHRNRVWLCQCDCGNQTQARATELARGARTSCGCLRRRKKIVDTRTLNNFLTGAITTA